MLDLIETNYILRRRSVESSNVAWIGWPETGEPVMVVEYTNGGRYAYLPVTRQRAVAAAYSPSVGSYIAKKVKPSFRCMKLREPR